MIFTYIRQISQSNAPHHSSDDDEFRTECRMDRKDDKQMEEEEHVIYCENYSAGVEARRTHPDRNKPKDQSGGVSQEGRHVQNVPRVCDITVQPQKYASARLHRQLQQHHRISLNDRETL